MTNYDLYRYIFIGGLVLSILMLIVTVLLFFLLKIKSAIGDITGSNKRKGIENILNDSASEKPKKVAVKYDQKTASTSTRLAAESMNTTKISAQDRFDNHEMAETAMLNTTSSETTVLNQNDSETTVLSGNASETTVLNENSSETTVLNENSSETTVLNQNASETTVLNADASATTVLDTPTVKESTAVSADPAFSVEIDITYVHSNEVIQ